ncbi:DUF1758 domain-containing protein [Trichonephila clavipes]|nr:DUF1758 domain-containing protein [Trichonephila clavipes]
MNFLRKEVQGARTGFGPQHNFRKNNAPVECVIQSDLATASALVSLDSGKRPLCIFCDKKHPSEKCFAAKKMALNDKQRILLKKGACFTCLKKAGHLSKFCHLKNNINCTQCNNSHFEIMCSKLEKENVSPENSLSNCGRSDAVFLQTLCVIVKLQGLKERVRALIDSASQSSYISERLVNQSAVQPLRTETVCHALFGGNQTDPKPHWLFSVEVSELRGMYTCNFEVLSERKIWGLVPKINNQNILKELRGKI